MAQEPWQINRGEEREEPRNEEHGGTDPEEDSDEETMERNPDYFPCLYLDCL